MEFVMEPLDFIPVILIPVFIGYLIGIKAESHVWLSFVKRSVINWSVQQPENESAPGVSGEAHLTILINGNSCKVIAGTEKMEVNAGLRPIKT